MIPNRLFRFWRCQQAFQIETVGEHLNLAIRRSRSFSLRSIPVELDAVPIGIIQVKRLTDTMITRSAERNVVFQQPAKRLRQFFPSRSGKPAGTARTGIGGSES